MTSVSTEEFNARGSLSADVARTFVLPLAQFEALLTADHHRLIGPRGSGKTTLLKMLTLDALRNWKHPSASKYIGALKFNSVFVQTDRAWASQLQILADKTKIDIGDTAFCIHTLICLIQSMKSAGAFDPNPAVAHLTTNFDTDKEVQFSRLVAKAISLDLAIPSFLGVETALRKYLVDLYRTGSAEQIRQTYCSENLMTLVSTLISIYNDLAGTPQRRWAFLFDELEIAPIKIIEYLINVMRGSDNRVILKLALAPFHQDLERGSEPTSPMAWHDFSTIRLTYANKAEALEFTSDLTRRIFADRGIHFSNFDEVFASREPRVERRGKTGEKYVVPEVMTKLAERDESFAEYAARKGLFEKDYTTSETERAADIRKILPIVQLREFYLREFKVEKHIQGQKNRESEAPKRPRKSSLLYTGFPSILEIAEGNPRVILTLMVPLARELAITREYRPAERLSVSQQNRAVERAVHVLESLVRAIPMRATITSSKKGLLDLLDAIGEYFSNRLLLEAFDPDYLGTFTVDKNVPADLVSIVGNALNAGALIYIPPDDGVAYDATLDLRGSRFRLSYLLAPRYGLPTTLGRVTSLHAILRTSATFRQNEPDLFHPEA